MRSWTGTIIGPHNVRFSCVIWVYFKWSFDLIFAWNFWYSHLIVSDKYVYIMFIYTNWNLFGRKSLQIELFFWRGVIISILLMYTILNWMWIPLFWSRYMMWFCVLFMRNNDEMENMGKMVKWNGMVIVSCKIFCLNYSNLFLLRMSYTFLWCFNLYMTWRLDLSIEAMLWDYQEKSPAVHFLFGSTWLASTMRLEWYTNTKLLS